MATAATTLIMATAITIMTAAATTTATLRTTTATISIRVSGTAKDKKCSAVPCASPSASTLGPPTQANLPANPRDHECRR